MANNKKTYHHKRNYNPAIKVVRWANMDKHVIQMFAAFVIALKECVEVNGEPISDEDIAELLSRTQYEWNKSINEGYDIADMCNSLYDIDVRREGK